MVARFWHAIGSDDAYNVMRAAQGDTTDPLAQFLGLLRVGRYGPSSPGAILKPHSAPASCAAIFRIAAACSALLCVIASE